MRDEERIPVILDKVKDLWVRHPDMRFGQLTYLIFYQMEETKKFGRTGIDMFHVEDDIFEICLDKIIKDGF